MKCVEISSRVSFQNMAAYDQAIRTQKKGGWGSYTRTWPRRLNGVGGQSHAPAALSKGNNPVHEAGRPSRAIWTGAPDGAQTPDHLARP